ncbi:hypothetical protein IF090_02860 [Acinetobacter towneri]|uniref:lipopolysaccharide kinase InaA family protein n=1 Tax=Acinetobacter towneri TaxID=202956 RepID=UPI001CE0A2EE|nr:lipopolysaccharide kinase InaA family protein [Acinetobacter towneri]MCA4778591.1 hypothetical protein [Acinetobacter towneri]MCA4783919.1 hypothetical protein [Acinetobacter towneri]MCA4786421.1 hypothetical protein [Acinetobacter towneri]MCA4795193.1 hypothetical protein [Acinetobacter towneri]MCA4800088.1 hypothetical protein [Acinetobacter towneri]
MSIKHKLKHFFFCIQNKSLRSSIEYEINAHFGHSEYSIIFDIREPHHLDTVCFWIIEKITSKRIFFGKFILNTNDLSIEQAGFKRYKGKEFIDQTLKLHSNKQLLNIPTVFKISENIIIFEYLAYPTFKSLYEMGHSPWDLITRSINSLRNLHQLKVYHYDPNWENILLDQKYNNVYFIDFDREILINTFSFDRNFFDIFKVFTNLFELKYTRKWAAQNENKIIEYYLEALTPSELKSFSMLTEKEIRIIFPKIDKKPILDNALKHIIIKIKNKLTLTS